MDKSAQQQCDIWMINVYSYFETETFVPLVIASV